MDKQIEKTVKDTVSTYAKIKGIDQVQPITDELIEVFNSEVPFMEKVEELEHRKWI